MYGSNVFIRNLNIPARGCSFQSDDHMLFGDDRNKVTYHVFVAISVSLDDELVAFYGFRAFIDCLRQK